MMIKDTLNSGSLRIPLIEVISLLKVYSESFGSLSFGALNQECHNDDSILNCIDVDLSCMCVTVMHCPV